METDIERRVRAHGAVAARDAAAAGRIEASGEVFPPLMYGLKGIMDIFSVCKSKAWRMRHGVLRDACGQDGNLIVIDVARALELFGISDPGRFIRRDGGPGGAQE